MMTSSIQMKIWNPNLWNWRVLGKFCDDDVKVLKKEEVTLAEENQDFKDINETLVDDVNV